MEINVEIQEILKMGRAAIIADDYETANECYRKAFNLDKENNEAFFYMGRALLEKHLQEENFKGAAESISALCNTFVPALKAIPEDERLKMAGWMFGVLVVSRKSLEEAMNKAYPKGKIPTEELRRITGYLVYIFKPLGDQIIEEFGDSTMYSVMAVDCWKEVIYMRYTYSAFRHADDKEKETWYDSMIKKIQKCDPEYKAPEFKQQPDCLTQMSQEERFQTVWPRSGE